MMENRVWRDEEFWRKELKNAGILERIPPFHTLTFSTDAPPSSLTPFSSNVALGGKTVDIYYWENGRGQVYLRIKN